jgi:hypothetical protein
MEHTHRHVIMVGNAPITMMAGKSVPVQRACSCGDIIIVGYFTCKGV